MDIVNDDTKQDTSTRVYRVVPYTKPDPEDVFRQTWPDLFEEPRTVDAISAVLETQ